MKLLTTLGLSLAMFGAYSQETIPCYSVEHQHEMADKMPQIEDRSIEFEQNVQNALNRRQSSTERQVQATRTIPVVFHIIYDDPEGNISREQIEDQLRILNEDFTRTNPDADDIPSAFEPYTGNPNIEFKLANFDPNGNCSEGIVRIQSDLTNEARDNVKSLSYWDSDRYLNVWVVNSIEGGGDNGIVLGFAQFPWWGSPFTDGVVLRHDIIGTIGTASGSLGRSNQGRTLTHEVGHWLGLRHIWGDEECGDDGVSDTPSANASNSGCPSFPHGVGTCSNNGTIGEMYMNYMDYTNGTCQNMFSQGQSDRMNAVLDSERSELASNNNLMSTGVTLDDREQCSPIADFITEEIMVCEGDEVTFYDGSWNAEPTAWNWQFDGGTPATSSLQSPSVRYLNPGEYDVSLEVSNNQGANSTAKSNHVYVSPREADFQGSFYGEPFDTPVLTDWIVHNDAGNTWVHSEEAGGAIMIQNRTGNEEGTVDYFITPSVDMNSISGPSLMYFDLAYRRLFSSNTDQLNVYVSDNCGGSWQLRYSKSGEVLETTPTAIAELIPDEDDWSLEAVPLGSFASDDNVRFKFEFISGGGNNIWIDNISVGGVLSVQNENQSSQEFQVYPNPSNGSFNIDLSTSTNQEVQINLYNAMGQIQTQLLSNTLSSGDYQFNFERLNLSKGIYFVELRTENGLERKRLIIQ